MEAAVLASSLLFGVKERRKSILSLAF